VRFLFALMLVLCVGAAACSREEAEPVPNVRLGMAPRDVRERFAPGAEGTWQTALGAGDDTVLEWTARQPSSPVVHARFEFHLGMLVAIRAQLSETVKKEHVTATPKTVTIKTPTQPGKGATDGGTTVMVLARDCPTHKDEAESFVAKSNTSR
jgi:hypothetical protein